MIKSFLKFPSTLLKKYNSSLLTSPYKTKMATAGFTYFLADYICQSHIEKRPDQEYAVERSLTQASVGAFFAAPSLHVWHSLILPKIVKCCTKNITRVLVSVFLNETILAGYFVSCLLFSFESLKKRSVEAGAENVKEKFLPAMESSMKFWTGISFVNYGLVPVHLRPVFVSCWSIVWQSYLSYLSNNRLQIVAKEEVSSKIQTDFDESEIKKSGLLAKIKESYDLTSFSPKLKSPLFMYEESGFLLTNEGTMIL